MSSFILRTIGRAVRSRPIVALLAMVAFGACRERGAVAQPAPPAPIVQPGAPGQASRVIGAREASDLSKVAFTDADARFMQGMIAHHAQALDMTGLLASRSKSETMHKLAQRIELSQADEIKMMQEWLRARGQDVPEASAHMGHGGHLMPGMLTPEQMQQLAAASGTKFDRLFLQFMISHHQGALVMVDDLLSHPGAAQEGEMFAFASDVNADQRMEIDRMSALLKELPE
jgi:uncharacterized protein (DUF305 family)